MFWKFWNNRPATAPKPSKPKELPSRLGRHLVVDLKYDPDWAWSLKIVSRPDQGSKERFEYRIFDPADPRCLGVKSFSDLDDRPEAVYFDGWYNKNSWEMQVNDHHARLTDKIPA